MGIAGAGVFWDGHSFMLERKWDTRLGVYDSLRDGRCGLVSLGWRVYGGLVVEFYTLFFLSLVVLVLG